jgi:poly-gamma-glutamate capsule biosynthesis protein CapA/YwtB (metallophosphatase superfamily)
VARSESSHKRCGIAWILRASALGVVVLTAGCDHDRPPGPSSAAPSASAMARAAAAPLASGVASASAANEAADAGRDVAQAESDRLVIVAGGDVNLGRGIGQQLLRGEKVNPFAPLGEVFRSADLRFVNLESQLSDQGGETQSKRNPLIFTGPPQGAALLARAEIDVVSLANNHMWDYGGKALLETMAHLREAGVAYVGASETKGQMYEPTIVARRGWSVAFFAVTHIWNQGPFQEHPAKHHVAWAEDLERIRVSVVRAKREHDVVLVSYHGGSEYVDVPMAWTRAFAKVVMNAGADALLGHHPHVPHGVGWFGARPAFYSLGNLVFHMHRDYPWTGTSFLARLTFSRGKDGANLQVEACPYRILGITPIPFEGKGKEPLEQSFKRHLELVSVAVGRTRVGDPGEHSCMPLEPPEKKRRKRAPAPSG